uniref:Uncharacterized protein n=1 Tax=Salix viminalis TaxID=40686 RepID=A0A6N2N3D0_SALVM
MDFMQLDTNYPSPNFTGDLCVGPRLVATQNKKNNWAVTHQGTHKCQLRPCELRREGAEEEKSSASQQQQGFSFIIWDEFSCPGM